MHRCFHVSSEKFLRTPFLQNTSGGCFCGFKVAFVLVRPVKAWDGWWWFWYYPEKLIKYNKVILLFLSLIFQTQAFALLVPAYYVLLNSIHVNLCIFELISSQVAKTTSSSKLLYSFDDIIFFIFAIIIVVFYIIENFLFRPKLN